MVLWVFAVHRWWPLSLPSPHHAASDHQWLSWLSSWWQLSAHPRSTGPALSAATSLFLNPIAVESFVWCLSVRPSVCHCGEVVKLGYYQFRRCCSCYLPFSSPHLPSCELCVHTKLWVANDVISRNQLFVPQPRPWHHTQQPTRQKQGECMKMKIIIFSANKTFMFMVWLYLTDLLQAVELRDDSFHGSSDGTKDLYKRIWILSDFLLFQRNAHISPILRINLQHLSTKKISHLSIELTNQLCPLHYIILDNWSSYVHVWINTGPVQIPHWCWARFKKNKIQKSDHLIITI